MNSSWGSEGGIDFMTEENKNRVGQGKATKENFIKHTVKDSVFTDIFGTKKYLLQLYQVLHPEDRGTREDDLKNITIKNILVNGLYNDLGFQVGERVIILVESQSSWTMNIIVRALLYLAQTYQDYLDTQGQDIYGSKKVSLPKPEIYVIYTGERREKPQYVSLSDEFFGGRETALEVKVKMLYGDNGDDIVGQYVTFTKVYNEQRKLYGRTKEAILETIRICKDEDVLKEYLESRESEVLDMMMTIFDDETIMRNHIRSQRAEAAIQSAVEMCQDCDVTFSDAVKKLAAKFGLSEKDAEEEVQKYWQ